jgi:hypothetical protein
MGVVAAVVSPTSKQALANQREPLPLTPNILVGIMLLNILNLLSFFEDLFVRPIAHPNVLYKTSRPML